MAFKFEFTAFALTLVVLTLIVSLNSCGMLFMCNCHLGWRTLVLKCNKNNYDCLCAFSRCTCMRN
jgi:hypothetical protein